MASADDSDDGWDEFLDQFAKQRYKNAFSEDNWEEVISNNAAFIQTLVFVTSVTVYILFCLNCRVLLICLLVVLPFLGDG